MYARGLSSQAMLILTHVSISTVFCFVLMKRQVSVAVAFYFPKMLSGMDEDEKRALEEQMKHSNPSSLMQELLGGGGAGGAQRGGAGGGGQRGTVAEGGGEGKRQE